MGVRVLVVIVFVLLVLSLFIPFSGKHKSCELDPILPDLSRDDVSHLSSFAYLAVDDMLNGSQTLVFEDRFDGICNKAYVVFRVSGKVVGSAGFKSDNLAESSYNAARKVLSQHSCEDFLRCPVGFNPRDLDRLQAELYVIGNKQLIK